MSLELIFGFLYGSCALLPGLVSALNGTDIKDVVINPSPAIKDGILAACLALL